MNYLIRIFGLFVYFNFLAARKPSYLLPFDYDAYIKKSRSHFFNMFGEMHAPICKELAGIL